MKKKERKDIEKQQEGSKGPEASVRKLDRYTGPGEALQNRSLTSESCDEHKQQ